MSELSPFTLVALAAVAVLVVGWLLVVFLEPGPNRLRIEWVATTAMFLALGSWFAGLSLDAWREGRTALLVPFGFLAVLFCAGLAVSLYKTVAQLVGRRAAAETATN